MDPDTFVKALDEARQELDSQNRALEDLERTVTASTRHNGGTSQVSSRELERIERTYFEGPNEASGSVSLHGSAAAPSTISPSSTTTNRTRVEEQHQSPLLQVGFVIRA